MNQLNKTIAWYNCQIKPRKRTKTSIQRNCSHVPSGVEEHTACGTWFNLPCRIRIHQREPQQPRPYLVPPSHAYGGMKGLHRLHSITAQKIRGLPVSKGPGNQPPWLSSWYTLRAATTAVPSRCRRGSDAYTLGGLRFLFSGSQWGGVAPQRTLLSSIRKEEKNLVRVYSVAPCAFLWLLFITRIPSPRSWSAMSSHHWG